MPKGWTALISSALLPRKRFKWLWKQNWLNFTPNSRLWTSTSTGFSQTSCRKPLSVSAVTTFLYHLLPLSVRSSKASATEPQSSVSDVNPRASCTLARNKESQRAQRLPKQARIAVLQEFLGRQNTQVINWTKSPSRESSLPATGPHAPKA